MPNCVSNIYDFPTWGSVTLGAHRISLSDFCTALNERCTVDPHAFDLLRHSSFQISSEPRTLDLVDVSGHELGMSVKFRLKEFLAHATNLGFVVCPANAVPMWCAYGQFPTKAMIDSGHRRWYTAMEYITPRRRRPCVFVVEGNGWVPKLCSSFVDHNTRLPLDARFLVGRVPATAL